MTDLIRYPVDDMSTTSKSLTIFLEEQWQQHRALFMNNSDSHVAILQAIARVIPGAGGKSGELATALANYHHQYEICYQGLHDLATMLDQAAKAMGLEDQQIAESFQPFE
jgi:hypothetical protein